jgi:hypothetical protein
MAGTVYADPGGSFEFFFHQPTLPSGSHVVAYFEGAGARVATDVCRSQMGGGFVCTGTVPETAPPGKYRLVRLTLRQGLEEHEIPHGPANEGGAWLVVSE